MARSRRTAVQHKLKILHAAAEYHPLAKTGGLADAVAALSAEQRRLDNEVRVVLPAYRGTLEQLGQLRMLGELSVRGQNFRVFEGMAGDTLPPVWLLDYAPLYARGENPYLDGQGRGWQDNDWRFGCFSEAVARIASGALGWKPQVVHLHDWHTALAAAWLRESALRPRVIFTIHNLEHQGRYGRGSFEALGLPSRWWSPQGVEFWGDLNCMKAGIHGADAITAVSPSYAEEILRPEFGFGLDGILRAQGGRLRGIVNGIDTRLWNPSTDAALARTYSAMDADEGKRANKVDLLRQFGLADDGSPLVVYVGRLAHQKGADLIVDATPALREVPLRLIILASGDPVTEQRLRELARTEPERIAVRIAHDEPLAHRLIAAADLFLMPSRFEPCGLTQMYAQRYGAIPVVRRTGGLGDTVVDATDETLRDGTASGVLFDHADSNGLVWGLRRGVVLWRDAAVRARLIATGMRRDFSWTASAREYLSLYHEALAEPAAA